jgi:hypothetical protein
VRTVTWIASVSTASGYARQKCVSTKDYLVRLLRTLRRAARTPDSDLTAGEAASTLFRFFRSNHVADLNLIATLAALVFLIHCLFVLVFVVLLGPVYHLFRHIFLHARHLFEHQLPGTAREALSVAQTGIGHTIVVLAQMLDRAIDVTASQILPALTTYIGPAIPVCGGVIAWAYLSAATRLGVVDLFACEIRTLCRVSTAFDIGKTYIGRYEGKAIDNQPTQSGGFKSEEDYFPVFTNNSHDLEALEATVVGNITEFYTYMKALRDLQRKLLETRSLEEAKPLTADSLFVLFLGFESARNAIKELIEFEPTQAENVLIILLTELVCYPFLCCHFKDDELRLSRLLLRLDDYKNEVRELLDTVDAHGDDPDWAPAKRTLPEFIERFNDMLTALKNIGVEQAKLIPLLEERRPRKSEREALTVQPGSVNQPVATAAA